MLKFSQFSLSRCNCNRENPKPFRYTWYYLGKHHATGNKSLQSEITKLRTIVLCTECKTYWKLDRNVAQAFQRLPDLKVDLRS
jgi:hypothetical protein